MTGAQIRAARGFLHWSVRDLGKKAKVHFNTVHAIERGKSSGKPENPGSYQEGPREGRGAIHQRQAARGEAEGIIKQRDSQAEGEPSRPRPSPRRSGH
jgi:hypothetical protein